MIYYQRYKINVKEVTVGMPQIFHDKEDKPKSYLIYPSELFAAINNQLSGNEAKVLLTLIGCKGDGSFSPSTAYMQKMTGITKPNNYYKTRKQLEDKGYIQVDENGNIYIDTQKIISQSKKEKEVDEQSESGEA
jgi:hypothetical protein